MTTSMGPHSIKARVLNLRKCLCSGLINRPAYITALRHVKNNVTAHPPSASLQTVFDGSVTNFMSQCWG